jgi:hypothetical protein
MGPCLYKTIVLLIAFSRPLSVQVVGYDEKVDQKAELTEINSDERVFALGKNSLPIFSMLQSPWVWLNPVELTFF